MPCTLFTLEAWPETKKEKKYECVIIETCATIFWERVERETSWKTCIYYVENSNMGTSLILLVVVEMGVIKYKNLNKYESKP